MQALQTFARLQGRVRAGMTFETSEERGAYLASRGLAVRVDRATETPTGRPSTQPPGPSPSEVNSEIVAVGGGWFEWRGRRYRGRAAVEAAQAEEG